MSPTRMKLMAQKLGVTPELLARCYAEAGVLAQSEAAKESWRRPQTRAKHAAATKRIWADPERSARMVEGIRRSNRDPETVEKRRQAARRRYADGAERMRLVEQGRKAAADPAVKSKKRSAMKARRAAPEAAAWAEKIKAAKRTPESRAKASQSLRAAWARRRDLQVQAKNDLRGSDEALIAEAIAAGRVVRCPTAAVGETMARIGEADRTRLRAHADEQARQWQEARKQRRRCYG